MSLIQCPECGKDVSDVARSCPSCGYPISPPPAQTPSQASGREWNPGVAAVLSLVIPGAGQIYKGQLANGLTWLVFVILGYALSVVPGIILHVCCIVRAYTTDSSKQHSTTGTTRPCPRCRMLISGRWMFCPHCKKYVGW